MKKRLYVLMAICCLTFLSFTACTSDDGTGTDMTTPGAGTVTKAPTTMPGNGTGTTTTPGAGTTTTPAGTTTTPGAGTTTTPGTTKAPGTGTTTTP